MLTIEYKSGGLAVSDFLAKNTAKNIVDAALQVDTDWYFLYSTENVFNEIRAYIVENRIDPTGKIQFEYRGKILSINRYGNLDHWPRGFIDTDVYSRIARAQAAVRIAERNDVNDG